MAHHRHLTWSTLLLLCQLPYALCGSVVPLAARQASRADANDLSWIKKWAAIGDSYAAGIGAGNAITPDGYCAQADGSYPSLINMQLGKSVDDVQLEFAACSGYKTGEITGSLKQVSPYQDMITISAGGNDANLVRVLQDCIFNWSGFLDDNCDGTLGISEAVIKGNELPKALGDLAQAAIEKLRGDGAARIYWTGYGQFFDTSSVECDTVTWGFWYAIGARQRMTHQRRQKMNELVIGLNTMIKGVIDKVNARQDIPLIIWVDWDDLVGNTLGRFCLPGVDESGGKGANRDMLGYYQWHTKDEPLLTLDQDPYTEATGGKRKAKRATQAAQGSLGIVPVANLPRPANTTEADVAQFITEGIARLGVNALTQDSIVRDTTNVRPDQISGFLQRAEQTDEVISGNKTEQTPGAPGVPQPDTIATTNVKRWRLSDWIDLSRQLPATWSRIFHPTQDTYAMIANQILMLMARENAKRLGVSQNARSPYVLNAVNEAGACPLHGGG